jgi:hypothetical protein
MTIYVGGLIEKVTASGETDYRHMIRVGGSTIIVSRRARDPIAITGTIRHRGWVTNHRASRLILISTIF